jgi:L-histidine N-alpha-methyltransferase
MSSLEPPAMSRGAAPDTRVASEVWAGLNQQQKELSPKYFYDARGAALFDEITRLPEYYLTRTERALLECWAPTWMNRLVPRSLVELGAGSADKTRILLDAMHAAGATYVPVDISTAYLEEVARSVAGSYTRLRVVPLVADITADLVLPDALPRPALFAFLGSTIGNFDEESAAALMRRVAHVMQPGDSIVLGADLRKDRAVIELAYNDARGITAEFNRNILRVLNREAATDFDIAAYDHLAYYALADERIEMHLVARTTQRVEVPGHGSVTIAAGESIRTEISCKYDRAAIVELFGAAGLELVHWLTDDESRYALALGRRSP